MTYALCALLFAVVAPDEAAPRLLHLPPAEAEALAALPIEVQLRGGPPVTPLRLYWESAGGGVRELELLRASDDRFTATIPAEELRPPMLRYWLAEPSPRPGALRFASAEAPQPVLVRVGGRIDGEERERRRRAGLLNEVRARGEWADFGAGTTLASAETEYRYARLGFFEEISIGAGTLEATAPDGPRAFRYGGSEVVARLGEHVVVGGKLLLGVSDDGFAAGGEGRLELGRRGGSRLELGAARLDSLGDTARVRLHWDTVPPLALAAGVELTTLPDDGAAAVRLLVDAGLPLGDRLRLDLRGGWQARGDTAGGATAGAGATLRF